MPSWDFEEFHRRAVAAPPAQAYAAIRETTLGEMPITRLLFAVRSLPDLVRGRRFLPLGGEAPLLDQMLDAGFVLLAEDPGREVVAGVVGRVGRLGGAVARVTDAEAFAGLDAPGHMKAAMSFVVRERSGGAWVETETRVAVTDDRSRRVFRAYWLLIRGGSGLIRRDWLRAIAARAERDRTTT